MLGRLLDSFTEAVYAALRFAAGLMFAFHGLQKFGYLGGEKQSLMTQVGIGGVIELVAGLAIAAGLFTRCAAFLASGTMLVAYVQFHWKFALDANFFPGINGGEPALLYSGLFLYFACRGAGRWSLDARRAAPKAQG